MQTVYTLSKIADSNEIFSLDKPDFEQANDFIMDSHDSKIEIFMSSKAYNEFTNFMNKTRNVTISFTANLNARTANTGLIGYWSGFPVYSDLNAKADERVSHDVYLKIFEVTNFS